MIIQIALGIVLGFFLLATFAAIAPYLGRIFVWLGVIAGAVVVMSGAYSVINAWLAGC